MALLIRHRRRAIACTLLASLIAGCAIFRGPVSRTFAFSHSEHVEEQGLDCIGCHPDAARADEPGMPTADTCSVCHDELDAEKPPERRAETLFDGDAFRAAHHGALGPERVFSHARHASFLQDCNLCHHDVAKSADVLAVAPVTMDDCTSCHDRLNVPDRCETCHVDIREDWAPASHERNWMRAHGKVVRRESEATADQCALCHQEETCVSCHRSEPPESHDVHWHLRGHGIASTIDRENCAACHTEDSCQQCHQDAIPRSHVANWGAPRDTHCLSCHTPLSSTGCVACHKNTQSHRAATPKPDDPVHLRGMDCRQCHVLGAMLPHVDNGDDCNACHH